MTKNASHPATEPARPGLEADLRLLARDAAREMRERDGLAPVDLERFWRDDALARKDAFGADIPQVPLYAGLTGECVYAELGISEDYWRYEQDPVWRAGLHRAYNDRAERIVGRRLLDEVPADPDLAWPPVRTLADLFESQSVWHDSSWWLQPAIRSASELPALLDRVERRLERPAEFFLPPDWDAAKDRLLARGQKVPDYAGQRGPVTLATSLCGTETFLLLVLDEPEVAARLRDLILRGMLARIRLLNEEAGRTGAAAPRGFWFADDNCCLMTPAMYEEFGAPILAGVFAERCPDPGDVRYQHSDSPMGHLLPQLARLGLNEVNLGPTLRVSEIRRHLPRAVIEGQLAPFTYSSNDAEAIARECLRDIGEAREQRGLRLATAGSIHNGTRLTSMRLVMSVIQRHGRYPA